MARSMNELPDYLRARGFIVDGVPGWRTRRRPARSGGYNPRGIVAHHTGAKTNTLAYAATTLTRGFLTLPGPLCQLSLTREGVVIFVASGRANHAGKVRSIGFIRAGDGNSQALGIEAMNTGTEGWQSPAGKWGTQLNAYAHLCAAIADYMDWDRDDVLGHGEVSTAGKWDPGVRAGVMLDMGAFREMVRRATFDVDTATPAPTKPSQPSPAPATPAPAPVVRERHGKWALINHGAATVALRKPGAMARWLGRRQRVVTITKIKRPDVLGGLECGSGSAWAYLAKKYQKFGYARIVGAGGRWLWLLQSAGSKIHERGISVPRAHDGDTKEVPWFVAPVNGQVKLTALAHLDPTASASFNVAVTAQILDHLEAVADRRGLKRTQIVLMIDTADKTGAVRRYIMRRGYTSVFTAAEHTFGAALSSSTYFRPPVVGQSVDDIFVGNGTDVAIASKTPPVKPTDLDHLVLAAVLSKQQ